MTTQTDITRLTHEELLALSENAFSEHLKHVYAEIDYSIQNEVNPNRLEMLEDYITYITLVR